MSIRVFITGANGGIGQSLCKFLKEKKCTVIASDLGKKCEHNSCETYIGLDLNRYVVDEIYREDINKVLKGLEIDVLINNAAIQLLGNFEDFSSFSWQRTQNINVSAVFYITQAFYTSLVSNHGQVINIASIHHKLTKPRFFAYATSKAALVGLTKSLAVEFKGKITVNAISPAAILTDMLRDGFNNDSDKLEQLSSIHPSREIGRPQQLAAFVYNLITENNRFINGSNIEINGGIGSALLDLDY